MGASNLAQDQRTPDSTFPFPTNQVRVDQGSDFGEIRPLRVPLASNNPYYSALDPMSPVSPVERHQTQPIVAPRPHRPADAERSAGLRRLEGSSEEAKPVRQVKVAKDMYDGQNPPDYESPLAQTMTGLPQDLLVAPLQSRRGCRTCGRGRTSTGGEAGDMSQEPLDDCTKCGKRKASVSLDPVSVLPVTQTRSVSDTAVAVMGARTSKPSASSEPVTSRPCCNKCGRKQRPDKPSATSRHAPGPADGTNVATSSATSSSSGRPEPPNRALSFGIEPVRPTHAALPRLQSGAPVEIDITPPTASTYRPVNSPFPDDSPLLDGRAKKHAKPSRSSSIASAISRTFSRRKSKKGSSATSPVTIQENPLPSQQLKHDGEHSPSRLISIINHAIHGNDGQDYAKLGVAGTKIDRPDSPFSFTDRPAEHEAFEMNDMRISKLVVDSDTEDELTRGPRSAPIIMEDKEFFGQPRRPDHFRSRSEAITSTLAVPSSDDIFLADPNQRPTITRFKSLRVGVERAASVTRSTSLRRLNSLKKTPELWYRTDMSLEGAIGAY